jgi:periplasmic divalent cation tolerance protein
VGCAASTSTCVTPKNSILATRSRELYSLLTSNRRNSRVWVAQPFWKMKIASKYTLVFVTAPDLKTARRLARSALEARLVACANLLPKIESHYWWDGKIERSTEVLILMKTSGPKLAALEKLIEENHPYDTPEFIALPLGKGSERYLKWITASVA